jgi:chromate reductase
MSDNGTISVLATSGSLRKQSFNTALLRAAQELATEGISIDIFEDLASMVEYPMPVAPLRERIRAADAWIFAAPEYNRSFPACSKTPSIGSRVCRKPTLVTPDKSQKAS